ncbi:uncharacterized protein LOC110837606 isoform X2 [Zootermopsis nevadensis]|uniref:uncharacterized protein LOC110837606 isoform X2 n=1 Tax=Zootermopsis nevadensis TaxID=136037 RepID=UPI000B8E8353|nr:uncharacterized protein LOC110837606 isoform X2 [Zootermopsis nevadensis]
MVYLLQSRSSLQFVFLPDSVLELRLAANTGQLAVLRRHMIQSRGGKTRLQDLSTVSLLEQKCERVYKEYVPIRVRSETDHYDRIMDNIVREELWEVDYPLTLGKLRKVPERSFDKRVPHEKPYNFTIGQRLAMLLSGRPNEMQSDHCISLLVSPKLCGTSPTCWDIMTSKDEETHGYSLTHRLLYLQIARQLGCGNRAEFADTDASIRNLCSDILVELYRIIELKVPVGFRDLFLEQIGLCGMEGFAEFLNPVYMNWILPLQTPSGCFADKIRHGWLDALTKSPSSFRLKREDGLLQEDGCTMHITGLATFFLALNIRAATEIWNTSVPISPVYRK